MFRFFAQIEFFQLSKQSVSAYVTIFTAGEDLGNHSEAEDDCSDKLEETFS